MIPVTFAEFTVTLALAGLNVKPLLVGVTVYVPFATLLKLKFPDASATAEPVPAPLRVSVVPVPFAAGLTVPDTDAIVVAVPAAGRTSTRLKLYLSPVGAVSLIVTCVPCEGVGADWRCTQYVSPTVGMN